MSDSTIDKPIVVNSVAATQASTAVKQALVVIGSIAGTLGLAPVVAGVTSAQAVMSCVNTALGGTAAAQLLGTAGALVTVGALAWQQWSSRSKAKKAVVMAANVDDTVAVLK